MNRGNAYDGVLIAVEGIDHSGKTTVMDAIDDEFPDAVLTHEPTDLWTGDVVDTALSDDATPALADFALFVADRALHVQQRIEPALRAGRLVVTDRYADSTRAYQTHRLADAFNWPSDATRRWMNDVFEPWNVEPDRVIYLDIDVDTAMSRGDVSDKYERRDNLTRVARAYDAMYTGCDEHVRRIDATQPAERVRDEALAVVNAAVRDRPQQSLDTYASALEDR